MLFQFLSAPVIVLQIPGLFFFLLRIHAHSPQRGFNGQRQLR